MALKGVQQDIAYPFVFWRLQKESKWIWG